MLNKDNLLSYLIVFFIGLGAGVGGVTLARRVQPAPIIIQPAPPTAAPTPSTTPGPMRIFVNGAVAAPAVYELLPGAIVQQAIELAGGFSEEANTAVVNLAQPLQDGMQIYVPSLAESADNAQPVITSPGSRSPDLNLDIGGAADAGQLVNINNATVEQLDTLPGIGPSTAEKIIEYRETNGPFATIEEIMSVSGIGSAKFEQIQAHISVGE